MSSEHSRSTDLGLFSRAIGVVTSPGVTFSTIVAAPRPASILFVTCVVLGLTMGLPQLTERGRRAVLDMQVQASERFTGETMTPEGYAALERVSHYGVYFAFVNAFVVIPFVSLLIAAVCWALFNIVLGGEATFGQVLGVVAHSQVIMTLGAVLGAIVQWIQGTLSPAGPFNLGALVPMLPPDHPVAVFLGGLTFFGIWQSIVLGIGLATLYRRRTASMILVLLTFYFGMSAAYFGAASLFSQTGPR